jgi:hypothetical protein
MPVLAVVALLAALEMMVFSHKAGQAVEAAGEESMVKALLAVMGQLVDRTHAFIHAREEHVVIEVVQWQVGEGVEVRQDSWETAVMLAQG